MMKKTLVALALAATTVSGSAMAWTANGTGGSLELGGTLTPLANPVPWEVLTGSAVANLNADIKAGTAVVDIPVIKPIPVLGIRTKLNQPFSGTTSITPQIDFKGAIDTSKFSESEVPLTLNVNDANGAKIGVMTTKMVGQGTVGRIVGDNGSAEQFLSYATVAGQAFFGGVPTAPGNIVDKNSVLVTMGAGFDANYYDFNNAPWNQPWESSFSVPNAKYSAYYGSGIKVGQNIKLTLDAPAASDEIVWKASLPIVVSYQ